MKHSRIRQLHYLVAGCHCSCLGASDPTTTCVSACGGLASEKVRIEIQSSNGLDVPMQLVIELGQLHFSLLWQSPAPETGFFFLSFPSRLSSSWKQLATFFLQSSVINIQAVVQKQVDTVVPLFDFRWACFIFRGRTMQRDFFFFLNYYLLFKSLTCLASPECCFFLSPEIIVPAFLKAQFLHSNAILCAHNFEDILSCYGV